MPHDRRRPGRTVPTAEPAPPSATKALRRVVRTLNRLADVNGHCLTTAGTLAQRARLTRGRTDLALAELIRCGVVEDRQHEPRPMLVFNRARLTAIPEDG